METWLTVTVLATKRESILNIISIRSNEVSFYVVFLWFIHFKDIEIFAFLNR